MKPCPEHKKSLALLATTALPEEEAAVLRAHLQSCPGCAAYSQEMEALCESYARTGRHLPEAQASPDFHERWTQEVHQSAHPTLSSFFPSWFAPWIFGLRALVPLGAAAILALIAWGQMRESREKRVVAQAELAVPASVKVGRETNTPEPSYAAYRMAANTSLEALDNLLACEAARGHDSAGELNIATASRSSLGE
jgi:anti-sigma factor RsiW